MHKRRVSSRCVLVSGEKREEQASGRSGGPMQLSKERWVPVQTQRAECLLQEAGIQRGMTNISACLKRRVGSQAFY